MINIDLTQTQLDSIAAQQAGAPAPSPTPTPAPGPTWNPPPQTGDPIVDIELNWNSPTRVVTPMEQGKVYAFHMKTGPGPSVANNLPRLAGAEWQSGACIRVAALSKIRGDFTGLPAFAATVHSSAITIPFTVSTPDPWGFYPVLDPNTDYWLNVKLAPASEIGNVQDAPMFMDLSRNGCP